MSDIYQELKTVPLRFGCTKFYTMNFLYIAQLLFLDKQAAELSVLKIKRGDRDDLGIIFRIFPLKRIL